MVTGEVQALMSDQDEIIEELLIDWVIARRDGDPVSPEQLCGDNDDLLLLLKNRISELRETDQLFDDETAGSAVLPPPKSENAEQLIQAFVSVDVLKRRILETQLLTAQEWSVLAGEEHTASAIVNAACSTGQLTAFQATVIAGRDEPVLRLGEYLLLDRIGEGGMGQVFRALHTRMDRVVAIKMLPQDALQSPEAVRRFEREVRAAARLEHPNIVTAYDAGEQDGRHFLVMQFVEGQDLSHLLREEGPLSAKQAIQIAVQTARGLEFAHRNGVVHRDIKPANLLIDENNTIRILDMGLARLNLPIEKESATMEGLTSTGMVMGTAAYMSPEQAEETHAADERSDIYSLGCTLFCLLTGQPPYKADSVVRTILAHRDQPIPSVRTLNDSVPEAVDTCLTSMLAKSPDDRPQTATELISRLEQLQKHLSAGSDAEDAALAQTALAASPRWVGGRRKRKALPLLVATVGVLLFGLLLLKFRGRYGTVIVELQTSTRIADVRLDGNTVSFSPDGTDKRLRIETDPGEYTLTIVTSDGTELVTSLGTRPLEITAGDTTLLRAWLEKDSPQATEKVPAVRFTNLPDDAPAPAVAPFDAEAAREHQQAWADYLGVPAERNIVIGKADDGSKITMNMVLIPPGQFVMGSGEDELRDLFQSEMQSWKGGLKQIVNEGPTHIVRITKPFWLSRTELTFGAFRQFVESTEYTTDAERDGQGGLIPVDGKWKQTPSVLWNSDQGFPHSDQHPVVQVSWNDAVAFCDWLTSTHQDEIFMLPTEAQWEYACRAGTEERRFCRDADVTADYGWIASNSGGGPHPVGQLKTNPFGLQDVYGNVFEWCSDFHSSGYYLESPRDDPLGPETGDRRVARSGPWDRGPELSRSAIRQGRLGGYPPTYRAANQGFRFAAEVNSAVLRPKNVPDRDLFAYVLSYGGTVRLATPRGDVSVTDVEELPPHYRFFSIDLSGKRDFNDAALARLTDLMRGSEHKSWNLNLDDTTITTRGLTRLKGFRLRQLLVKRIGSSADDVCRTLVNHDIGMLQIDSPTDQGLRQIAQNERIFHLMLFMQSVSPDGLLHLRDTSITALDLFGGGAFDAKTLGEFAQALQELSGLMSLDIRSFRKLTHADLRLLADALPVCSITTAIGTVSKDYSSICDGMRSDVDPVPYFGLLPFNTSPPKEFTVEFAARRTGDFHGLGLRVPQGTNGEHRVIAILGGWEGTYSGLNTVDGIEGFDDGNPTRRKVNPFADDQTHHVRFEVTSTTICALVDDNVVLEWDGDPRRLDIPSFSEPMEVAPLYLKFWGKFEISNLTFSPAEAFPLQQELSFEERFIPNPRPVNPILTNLIPPEGESVRIADVVAAVRVLGGKASVKDWTAGRRVELVDVASIPSSDNLTVEFADTDAVGDPELQVLGELIRRAKLTNVSLWLDETAVTGRGLAALREVPMYVVRIRDSGMDMDLAARQLAAEDVREVDLTGLGDEGITWLRKNPRLQHLTLSAGSVSPDGLKQLSGSSLNRLTWIGQTDSPTAEELTAFAELNNLSRLRLNGYGAIVTDDLNVLAGSMPFTRIEWDDGEIVPQPARIRDALKTQTFRSSQELLLAESAVPPFEMAFTLRRASGWGPISIRVPMGKDGQYPGYLWGTMDEYGLVRRVDKSGQSNSLSASVASITRSPFSDFDRHQVHLTVRHNALKLTVDENVVIDWKGDPSILGVPPDMLDNPLIEQAAIYLYSPNPIEVSDLKFTPEAAFRDWRNGPQEELELNVAKRMLELGGTITVQEADFTPHVIETVDALDDLSTFRIHRIKLYSTTDVALTEDDFTDFAALPELRELRLTARVTDSMLQKIGTARKLETLVLTNAAAITSEGVLPITRLPRLTGLQMWNAELTDELIAQLPIDQMRSLSISETQVGEAGWQHLNGGRLLRNLEVGGVSLPETAIDVIASLTSIDRLVANQCQLSDGSVAKWTTLTNLDKLFVERNPLTDACIPDLIQFAPMTSLAIRLTEISPDGIARLHAGLPGCSITHDGGLIDEDWRAQPQEALTRDVAERMLGLGAALHVWHGDKQAIPVSAVDELTQFEPFRIRSIDFRNAREANLTVDDFTQLGQMQELRHLRLPACTTDEMLQQLTSCLSLNQVMLQGTRVTPEGLSALSQLPSPLDALVVTDTPVTATALEAVDWCRLKTLSFARSDIAPEVWQQLQSAERLEVLDLKSVSLTPDELTLLCSMPGLTTVNLDNCGLRDEDLKSFTESPGFERLYLNDNKLTDRCVPILSGMTGLKILSVQDNSITASGLQQLREALPDCQILEPLGAPEPVDDDKKASAEEATAVP